MITSRPFGTMPDGRPVTCYRLTGGPKAYADVLDYGGTVQAIVVPDQNGTPVDVVLGYDDLDGYRTGTCFFGATVGRHANRIGGAAFTLGGNTYTLEKNAGPNNLHGGPEGFDRRLFSGEIDGDKLKLRLTSPHMDQGFPGELRLTVTFTFSPENELTIRYEAVCDRDTVVNLTNHSYFDLSGGRNPMGQLLRLDADRFCEGDENTLPTGRLLEVEGTPFDFREEKPVGRDLHTVTPQLTSRPSPRRVCPSSRQARPHGSSTIPVPKTGSASTSAVSAASPSAPGRRSSRKAAASWKKVIASRIPWARSAPPKPPRRSAPTPSSLRRRASGSWASRKARTVGKAAERK